ncbi:hypothetical protein EDF70_10591 [Neorhizobium sp. JUb45]|nr:hypothetical protein EDF70_10591 [Neorhizobium sp. JUb45]
MPDQPEKNRRSTKVRRSGGQSRNRLPHRGDCGGRSSKTTSFSRLRNEYEIVGANCTVRYLSDTTHLLRTRHTLAVSPFLNAGHRYAADKIRKGIVRNIVISHVTVQLHGQNLPILGKISNPNMGRDRR